MLRIDEPASFLFRSLNDKSVDLKIGFAWDVRKCPHREVCCGQ